MIPIFSVAAAQAGLPLASITQRVIESGWYLMGRELAGFETEFAAYLSVTNCVGVANGTDALELALRAAGVTADDLVVAQANAGFYGSTAIRAIGAIPLYVDVDPQSLTLSPAALKVALAKTSTRCHCNPPIRTNGGHGGPLHAVPRGGDHPY